MLTVQGSAFLRSAMLSQCLAEPQTPMPGACRSDGARIARGAFACRWSSADDTNRSFQRHSQGACADADADSNNSARDFHFRRDASASRAEAHYTRAEATCKGICSGACEEEGP